MRRRRTANLATGGVVGWHVSGDEPDGTWINTRVEEGPAGTIGRYVLTRLADGEVLELLAAMAYQPRWAVAIAAIAGDPVHREAVTANIYHAGHTATQRQALVAKMRAAMARRDEENNAG